MVSFLTWWTTTNCSAACQRTRLWPLILLLFLILVQASPLKTARDIALCLAVMAIYTLIECNRIFDRYQFRKHLLFGSGCRGTTSRHPCRRRILLICIILFRFCVRGINPFKCLFARFLSLHLILYYLSHLRVQECVSNDHFFFLQVFLETFSTFEREIVEVEWQGTEPTITQPLFKLLQLLNEGASNF